MRVLAMGRPSRSDSFSPDPAHHGAEWHDGTRADGPAGRHEESPTSPFRHDGLRDNGDDGEAVAWVAIWA